MTTSSQEVSFADATAVKALSSHVYEANFPDDWCIGSVPHGGYVTSVFLQVASKHFKTTLSAQNQPHTIGLHLDFLRRTQGGRATFTVKDTKLGRQTSVVHITLTQDGREEVVGSLTQSNIDTESGVSFDTSFALVPAPLPVDLKKLEVDEDENWVKVGHMPHSEFRKATKKTQFCLPRNGQKNWSWSDQYMRLASGEKWTNESIGYVVDMFRMPVESHLQLEAAEKIAAGVGDGGESEARKFWYPTVLLNLDVKKKLPVDGVEWLLTRTTAKVVKNGRMDLEIVVLDEENAIVALSHHIALAVGSERNLAKRVTSGSKI
ncbi:thioesterase-like superfamily-domain-containing protein [Rhexocercosporidium sp. MPI-PUGE-AT-0058]|nr:thioesterase-like superfamily-domain-containing protein [Rhexocercosporidium sp. MPI-PUGE-AT-0058]